MNLKIAVVPGDGIGPDIVSQAIKVLDKVCELYGHNVEYKTVLAGGAAIDKYGVSLPSETLETCKKSDAVLLGAVGGPKWDNVESSNRPEKALLGLRSGLGLFCNLRPAILYKQLKSACPLRSDIIGDGLDIMVVRELTGGIYFGKKGKSEDCNSAYDIMSYSKPEIERIARKAFEIAKKRNSKVTSVDKANVLETSRLWRATTEEVKKEYPECTLDHLYVDNASMQLVKNPHQFDVILTENMFGDILSDEASMITGSIGMLPSASLREDSFGMYEPIHGSAPDIAGLDIANPIATILSVSMMLRYTFNLSPEADAIEKAVYQALEDGYRTPDIYTDGMIKTGTIGMGDAIVERLK